jgi:catechol 2,3-dioxygenase-like lactoylglutathione lyase family enzyme/mannose-6-phosphate isomerase-like protein (cupin superfamily)
MSRPAPPFAVRRLDHVVLRTADLDRAIAFWRDGLGCEVARRRDELGLVHLRAGDAMIDLVDVAGPLGRAGGAPPGEGGRNVDHVCLRVDPFDPAAIAAHLDAFGVAYDGRVQQRFGAQGEGPSIYATDPDGNVVELKGPPMPMPGHAVALDPLGTFVHLRDDGRAEPMPVDADFWSALAAGARPELDAGRLVGTHAFASPWTTWERHPAGDEWILLLSGAADLVLEAPDGTRVLRLAEPGEHVVVPAGTWHTARTDRPTRLLFATPGRGTEHRPA